MDIDTRTHVIIENSTYILAMVVATAIAIWLYTLLNRSMTSFAITILAMMAVVSAIFTVTFVVISERLSRLTFRFMFGLGMYATLLGGTSALFINSRSSAQSSAYSNPNPNPKQ